MAQIFVSYSRADQHFVREFIPLLRRIHGNDNVWYDDEIIGGADWWQLILNQIAECEVFIYLISNDSLESPYCQAEAREAIRLRKLLVPILIRPKTDFTKAPENLREFLKRTQYIDWTHGTNDAQAARARSFAQRFAWSEFGERIRANLGRAV